MTQPVGIVDVLVARGDLVETLADQRGDIVRDIPGIAGIGHAPDDVRAEAELLIELADEQEAGVGGEGAAGEIDDEFRLESEAKLAITLCSNRTSSVGTPSRRQAPRKYHDFSEGDGVFTYSFVNYSG